MSNRIIMAAAGVSTGSVSTQEFITRLESVTMATTIVPTMAIDSTTKETYIGARNSVAKFNADGTLAWQRSISATNVPVINGLAVLSSQLIVITSGETNSVTQIIRLNKSDGSLVTNFNYTGLDSFEGKRTLTLSDGSYLIMYDDGGFSFPAIASIAKYSSSHAFQWRSTILDAGEINSYYTQDMSVDPSGSIYLLIHKSVAAFIYKMNSDGTLAWQRSYTVAVATSLTTAIATSSDSVYLFGTDVPNGAYVLTKLNSSTGAVVWERTITVAGTRVAGAVRVGPDGAIYCSTNLNTAGIGSEDIVVYKFDASGNIVWQRALGTTGVDGQGRPRDILFDGLGNYYIAANTPSASRLYIARLPLDGTLTGTYTPFSYNTVSHTISTTSKVSTATSTEPFSNGTVAPTTGAQSVTAPTTAYTATRTLL
jgi:PQQ-like domain